jgi:hypothetical protein
MTLHTSTGACLALAGVLAWAVPGLAQPGLTAEGAPGTVSGVQAIAPAAREGLAAPPPPPPAHITEAEKRFWACENASRDRVLDTGDAVLCSGAYELLLKERFGGRFSDLLSWWQREKAMKSGTTKAWVHRAP